MEKKYLIICLRNNYWERHENVVFWGKNNSGYEMDLSKVGLYTKEEALKKVNLGDCFISIDKLGITKEILDFKNSNIEIKVKKNTFICDYVNKFRKIMKNKLSMAYGIDFRI